MLQPKRTKFRKQFKGRISGVAKGGTDLNFGQFGLKAQEPERVTARQIEAARRAITRAMKRAGRVWIRIFPDVPVSKKPTEVRMGKGKGSPEFWAAKVKPGRIMFGSTACRRISPARRSVSAPPSCRSRPVSSNASPSKEGDMKATQRLSDLKVMSTDQLQDELLKLKKEQFNLRFQRATGQLENTARVTEVRKDIARVKTLQRSKTAAVSA